MKAAILTLALAMFMLGASATYVKASGGFSCEGILKHSYASYTDGYPKYSEISIECG